MRYLTELTESLVTELQSQPIADDYQIESFWSDDILELYRHIENQGARISQYPHLYVVCPTITSQDRFAEPTAILDSVTVHVWVVSQDSKEEERKFYNADAAAALTRAYLSRPQFSTVFTNDQSIDSWQIIREDEDDEIVVYSVIGELEQHVDNDKLITEYET